MKKNKKMRNQILNALAAFLALVALLTLFAPAVVRGDTAYTGAQVVFGYTETASGSIITASVKVFAFSFMNLLTYLLILVTLVLSIFGILKENSLFSVISCILALLAAIFMLLVKNFVVVGEYFDKIYQAAGSSFANDSAVSLGWGTIVGSVSLFLAFAVCGLKAAFGYLKK